MGGPYAVQEALELARSLARRGRQVPRRSRKAAAQAHRRMAADWVSHLEAQVAR
jgi:hypothetical protein